MERGHWEGQNFQLGSSVAGQNPPTVVAPIEEEEEGNSVPGRRRSPIE